MGPAHREEHTSLTKSGRPKPLSPSPSGPEQPAATLPASGLAPLSLCSLHLLQPPASSFTPAPQAQRNQVPADGPGRDGRFALGCSPLAIRAHAPGSLIRNNVSPQVAAVSLCLAVQLAVRFLLPFSARRLPSHAFHTSGSVPPSLHCSGTRCCSATAGWALLGGLTVVAVPG